MYTVSRFLQVQHDTCVSRIIAASIRDVTQAEESFGQQVRAARTARGWSQAQLADALGLDASGVSRLESGRKRLGLSEAVRIASALGVSLDRLIAPVSAEDRLTHALTSADDAVVLARRGMVAAVTALGDVVIAASESGEEVTRSVIGDTDVAGALTVRVSRIAAQAGTAQVPTAAVSAASMWATAMGDRITVSTQRDQP